MRVGFTEAELKGVPDSAWKDQPRDGDGKVTLAIDGPAYATVMQTAEDAGARERLWRAKTNEGGAENLKLLAQIEPVAPRAGQAVRASPATTSSCCAGAWWRRTAHAAKFLDDVRAAVADGDKPRHRRTARGQGAGIWARRRKRRSCSAGTRCSIRRPPRSASATAVDDEAFRPYFPPQESLRFVMRVAEKMYGVRYDKVDNANVLGARGAGLGRHRRREQQEDRHAVRRPLSPRDGKYNHAAVWNFRNGATSVPRQAQSALVVNFDQAAASRCASSRR